METTLKHPKISLQFFAEGGDGGTAEGTGVTATGAESQEGVKSTAPQSKTTEDRNAEYKAFIEANKDLDDARIQSLMQKRVKDYKEVSEKHQKTIPVLELLGRKYGVDASDIEALTKAMNDDDSYFEQEAMEKGISVEQLKEFKKMEKENAELRKARDEQARKENADRLYAKWTKEAEATKMVYPNFSLENEVRNNPKFVELLRNNIDVRSAYEVTHKDEIIAGAMQFAVKEAESKLTNSIIANGSRPSENGISSKGASQVKSDVSKLTKAERDDIARRVARGEKISFS